MGQLEQFLSDISPNGDWQPLIDYINQNYVSKDKIEEKIDYQYMLWNTLNRQKEYSQDVVDILEELLEENNNE